MSSHTTMSDADADALRNAIADAGMEAMGWGMEAIERGGIAALKADPIPFFARALAHFRIGLLDRAARYNWSHAQRYMLALYAVNVPGQGGDELFIFQFAEAVAMFGAATDTTLGVTIIDIDTHDIIPTATKLQSAVANELANERQANAPGSKDTRAHGRYENFAPFRVTMGEN